MRRRDPDEKHQDDPADAVREPIVQRRHAQIEGDTDGCGRDRDHRPGKEAKHQGVDRIVDGGEFLPADLFQHVVQRQPEAGCDGGAEECPAQHGQKVAQKQAPEESPGRDAVRDEERTDDELRARRVLADVHADEAPPAFPLCRGNRCALEFLHGIQLAEEFVQNHSPSFCVGHVGRGTGVTTAERMTLP